MALNRTEGPTALALTRQNLPTLATTSAEKTAKGAYIVNPVEGTPDVILMASGSELHITVEAAETLQGQGIKAQVVSFPSWDAFEAQSKSYQDEVLSPSCMARVVVEAGRRQGWERYAGPWAAFVTIERFGESANAGDLAKAFGITAENVVEGATDALAQWKAAKATWA